MQGRPSLVVAAVDVGPVLHKELHHLEVVVDAGLKKKKGEMEEIKLNSAIQQQDNCR